MLLYGTGSVFAIIGFVLWPDLPTTQSLNHAFKIRPMVYPKQRSVIKSGSNSVIGMKMMRCIPISLLKLAMWDSVWREEKKRIVQPTSLWSSILWSRGNRKEILVDRTHVRTRRNIKMMTNVGLKFKHWPQPRARATATPYNWCLNVTIMLVTTSVIKIIFR